MNIIRQSFIKVRAVIMTNVVGWVRWQDLYGGRRRRKK